MKLIVSASAAMFCLTACSGSKAADRDAAECAVRAQQLYPHDTFPTDDSKLGLGLPLTFEQNCMKAKGYVSDPFKAGCNVSGDKNALFTGACYSGA